MIGKRSSRTQFKGTAARELDRLQSEYRIDNKGELFECDRENLYEKVLKKDGNWEV